jgi:thiamine-phosphate diphosphorylase
MKDATDEEVLAVGAEVHRLCRKYGATFIVDDRVGLVGPLGADGVHLGKNDMAPSEARKILGDKIIGATANTMEDVERALAEGADYLGIGPFRFTTTKKNLAPVLGLDGYRRIMARKIPVPVVAIGGILLDDLRDLKTTGVTGVAVSGLILNSTNPEETTRQILNIWKN